MARGYPSISDFSLHKILDRPLKPGDLVFYKNTSYQADEAYKRITHAGIYAGNGKILHAGSSTGVAYSDIGLNGSEIAGYAMVNGVTGGLTADDYKAGLTMLHSKIVDQERIHNDT